jgi:hypothetical protein
MLVLILWNWIELRELQTRSSLGFGPPHPNPGSAEFPIN